MFATLINQVRAITGSSTGETSNDEVVDLVRHGVRYVLSSLPITLSFPFASNSSSIASAVAITVDTNKLLTVERNSIDCVQVPESLSYEIGDSNSIHLATARYPAFYLTGNSIYVKPNPTATATASAVIIDIPAKVTAITSTSTSSIGQFDNIVVKYGAALEYAALSGYWEKSFLDGISSTDVTAGYRDALDNAQALIDDKTDYDAEDFLAEEDSEMSDTVVKVAAQEVNRALAEIQNTNRYTGATGFIGSMLTKSKDLFTSAERDLRIIIGGEVDSPADNRTRQQ